MNLDLVLWAILGLFGAWEIFAHFVARNRGAHTLSNRILALEKAHPKTRVATVLVLVALILHLAVGWF